MLSLCLIQFGVLTLFGFYTGITSDPLTQLAVVFSALIHDVDHTGVPNAQLVKEGAEIASIYKNKSVAEQNSIGTLDTVLTFHLVALLLPFSRAVNRLTLFRHCLGTADGSQLRRTKAHNLRQWRRKEAFPTGTA